MKMKIWMAALAVSAGLCTSAMAQVTGKATLDGKAPEMKEIDMSTVKECNDQHPDPVKDDSVVASEKGELANVVVSVKKEEGMDLPGDVPKTAAELDQHGCMYSPHVLTAMIGQEIVIKNQDTFLHNVHALSSANPPFNFGQPTKDDGKKIDPFKTVETFKVKCDVHPWMLAYVRVFDHPFFATSKEDGTYSITAKLPDGEYTFVGWHEKFGEVEQKGTVKDGKAEVNFVFKSSDAAAPASKEMKEVAVKSDASCPSCDKPEAKVVEKDDKVLGPQAMAR